MEEQRASSSHHHDLSDAITNCYYENVQKLKDVLKASDPFATAARLAQLGERRSAEREAVGSSPGRTNTQGL